MNEMDLVSKVKNFQKLVVSGAIDEAYEKYVALNMRHHNAYFRGDRESLKEGMKENHKMFPHKEFIPKKALLDGDHVCMFSHVKLKPSDAGLAIMHIFRFENGKIVEMWDMGTPIPENSPNENGMF